MYDAFRREQPSLMQDADWLRLLADEQSARKDLQNSEGSVKNPRAWWRTVSNVLQAYGQNMAAGIKLKPAPSDLIVVLAKISSYLAVGQIPEPIQDVAGRGQTKPGPTEEQHIRLAVAYRIACKSGGLDHLGNTIRIKNRRPSRTLSDWFSVDRKTVQGWVRKWKNTPPELGFGPVDAVMLANETEVAGKAYSKWGRSQQAIAWRAPRKILPQMPQ